MSKTIYIAFANQEENPLAELDRERETIYRVLSALAREEGYVVYQNPKATTENIVRDLKEFQNDICIFHYSGHADKDQLLLEDKPGDPEGLSYLLKSSKNLRLIFLNGCSTREQAKYLLDGHEKRVVIATELPIPDEQAADFAITFYEQLSILGNSIAQAYEFSKGVILWKKSYYREFSGRMNEVKRGIFWNEPEAHPFSWQLNSNNGSASEWVLEYSSGASSLERLPYREMLRQLAYSFKPIVSGLLDVHQDNASNDLEYIQEIFTEWQEFRIQVDELKDRKRFNPGRLIDRIANILPTPLGVKLMKLLRLIKKNPDNITEQHLHLAIKVYDSVMEILTYTMISQLWETLNYTEKKLNDSSELQHVKNFFLSTPASLEQMDLVEVIRAARRIFDKISVQNAEDPLVRERFVSELSTTKVLIKEEGSDLRNAYLFFKDIKEKVSNGNLYKQDVSTYYQKAERHLCAFLSELSFIVRYSLITVKTIFVLKYRHRGDAKYSHKFAPLLLRDSFSFEAYPFKEPAFTQTVVLLKDLNQMGHNLPLSPFIIDKSAFIETAVEADLHVYAGYDKDQDTFIYRKIDQPTVTLKIGKGQYNYNVIREQLDEFSQCLFGKPINQLV